MDVGSWDGNDGIFRMSGGIIHGDDAPGGLGNMSSGARALMAGGIAEHGTLNAAGAFNRLGDLASTNCGKRRFTATVTTARPGRHKPPGWLSRPGHSPIRKAESGTLRRKPRSGTSRPDTPDREFPKRRPRNKEAQNPIPQPYPGDSPAGRFRIGPPVRKPWSIIKDKAKPSFMI